MLNSPSKSEVIPEAASKRGLKRRFIYTGSSMKPTFRTGQLLYVRPDVQDVRPGDVLVFEAEKGPVVHRVLTVKAEGYVTRGDNNRFVDATPVPPDRVIGRVEMFDHKRKIRPVRSGWHGLWAARLGWFLIEIDRRLRSIFGWPYRWVRTSRILVRLWKPVIIRVRVQTETGPLIKYIYHQRTVAVWEPSKGKFSCRKPFDLVLFRPDEEQ
jgi:signal peptidase I